MDGLKTDNKNLEIELRNAATRQQIHDIFDKYHIDELKNRTAFLRDMRGNPASLCKSQGFTESQEYQQECAIFLVFDWEAKACLDKLAAEGLI